MTSIGYCGVVVPSAQFWQGYYLDGLLLPYADAAIARARATVSGVRIINPIPDNADQQLVGGFCATLVEGALAHRLELVGVAAIALYRLTQRPHFLVTGNKHAEGTRTTIKLLDVSSVEEARTRIDTDPLVVEVKRAILRNLKKPHH